LSLNNAHEGYDYQDLLTSYFILREVLLGNKNSIFSVDKKHTTGDTPDRFDDLVITNGSNIQRKQIKYSNDNVARKLIKNDFSNDSKGLALHEIYKSWNELKTTNSEFRLCLAWDEATDNNITRVLEPLPALNSSFPNFTTKLYKINLDNLWEENPTKFNQWTSLKNYVAENSLDRNDFKTFCNELIIELELPKASLNFNSPSDLENILYHQVQKLGIGQYPNNDIDINRFLIILAKKAGEYRTRSAEVTTQDILRDLKVKTDFGKIEQKFEIDQDKNIKNNEKFTIFQSKLIENKKTLLIGEPGSGKSWFLTNFIEYLNVTSIKVIRHYCFTDTEDEYIEKRVSSDVFFGNLIADTIKEFPHLQKVKEKLFVSDLDELNLLLSHIDEELIIVIDGLDHINRVLKSSSTLAENKTKIIEFISQIKLPKNIFIVLGSQPVDEIGILIEKFEYVDYKIPKWNIEDTVELMNKYSLENILLDTKFLSEYIFEKSEANPLYLTYIIKTLIHEDITLDVIERLPSYDFNLQAYYEYLTEQIDENLTSEILSCLEFSVTKEELSELIHRSHHLDKNLKILSPVIVENVSRGGIKLYHDSFRRFNIEKLEENANLEEIYEDISKWLKKQGFYKNTKSYRYLLRYYIKLKKYKNIKKYATNDFLTKSLYRGYSEGVIKINYDNFLYVARETLDWSLYIFISELNRTIYTTISDDYNSEFLERFELYFEAVGSIYGFERANEMLFFDGAANFSKEIIAKAFYISQKNGLIPNWSLLENYFKDEIPLEDYPYYISSLIALNIDLDKEFKELLDDGYNDFFNIYIKEVFHQIGFNKIYEFYNNIESKEKTKVGNRINNILNRTLCNQRILVVANNKRHIVLEELRLDFISGYIKEEDLNRFYHLVKMYASYNIEVLKGFEQLIPSENFFFNWLKFFIRNFIIEINLKNHKYKTYNELEKAFIENFEFLASDVEVFKGKPRAVDFTHQNSKLINFTLAHGLKYIQTKNAWSKVFTSLNKIPYNTLTVLEDRYINEQNIYLLIDTYEEFDKSEESNYSEHLEYSFKKAIYYSKIDKKEIAKKELKKAVFLMTSYTFHKDRTLSEIIEPLSSVNNIDSKFTKKYAKKLKYLTDSVIKHTDDGKDTRWLTTEWFEEFLKVDYKLSAMYLINQLLNNTYFWKLDYMFVDYMRYSKNINPIILNFLFKLSPTNSKNNYINSFCDNINVLINIDEKLAKQSLINILARDLNSSYDTLTNKTTQKLQTLKNILNVSALIKQEKNNNNNNFPNLKDSLDKQLNKIFEIDSYSLNNKTIDEINKYFDKKDELSDKDLNSVFFYLLEKNDTSLTEAILIPLIQKRFPRDDQYFEKMRQLINFFNTSDNTKIFLLVNTFIHSKDGWFSQFVNKKAFKDAIEINKEETLNILAKSLSSVFSNFGYGSKSTANLIIAFEYAGINKKCVLSMYQTGFEAIEYRLPDKNDFEWKDVEDTNLEKMNQDELAIVVLLSKMINTDSFIQKDIIFAINYLLKYDEKLLIKPIKWFFRNIEKFPHISIVSLFEIFLLYSEVKVSFFKKIKNDMIKVQNLENLYIQNILKKLLTRIDNV
jgi:hypothetical protein